MPVFPVLYSVGIEEMIAWIFNALFIIMLIQLITFGYKVMNKLDIGLKFVRKNGKTNDEVTQS